MKTKAIWVFYIFFSIVSCKKDIPFDSSLVVQTTVHSTYTGSSYPVYIVLPENYNSQVKYETMYVLDGDDALEGLKVYEQVGWACKNSSSSYQKQNVIVVAISSLGQDERFRDYSPVPGLVAPIGVGGGSENFAKFFQLELIPFIQQNYSVDTTSKGRIIVGHSLGGSFTGFMFTKHPDVFTNYLTLSPAFWWGDGVILKYEEDTRSANSIRNTLVFVGCGELEEGIKIYSREWSYRLKTYYPNCLTDFNMVSTAGHLSSAKTNVIKSIDFYFKNK